MMPSHHIPAYIVTRQKNAHDDVEFISRAATKGGENE